MEKHKNFNLKYFDEIISMMDIERIRTRLEKEGFRCAGQDGIWEFDYTWIKDNCAVEGVVKHEDVFADKEYRATIYTDGERTFIDFSIFRIERRLDNLPVPWKFFLYTDAPINEAMREKCSRSLYATVVKKRCVKGI